ncbi:MAG: hypothetical protein KC620_01860 [Myxococcales bacterium]|nr:hypothetical protein [Myxococcales bacterium]
MNVARLIDAIVRQTTVLIAQLATSAGMRAPLAHLANQVFLDLVRELEAQGLGRRVVADMFGIALRSYQLKVRRISESATIRDRSLWEAVLDFIQQAPVRRARVLERFGRDDVDQVRAVLHDLVESGLVFRAGRGDDTLYRAAAADDLDAGEGAGEALATFVWALIYREGPLDRAALDERVAGEPEALEAALAALAADGRIEPAPSIEGEGWQATRFVVPLGSEVGYEAALFDHFQALVAAMCAKIGRGQTRSGGQDVIGGSTWSFDVWPGHPHEAEVYGLLAKLRAQVAPVRTAVAAHNATHAEPPDATRVTVYVGQGVAGFSEDEA